VLAFEREKVDRFVSLLKSIHDQEHNEPRHIFNLEESGVTSVPEPGKILAITGRKQVGRIASGEKGQTVTIVGLAAVSAMGQFIPPAMIFPRKRFSNVRYSLDLFSFRHVFAYLHIMLNECSKIMACISID